ncbi:MAG: cation transporting ATPase C-terminal domain-containing protein, partial [Patescibacteria group bacterium]
APARKAANVARVVAGGADIAREAADIVLLKKSLSVIIDGIHEGREVFANTMKYIRATLSSNFGNFYAVAIASLFVPFLPMLPVQILLLNLLSDFPMISIATDSVDPEEIRAPRKYHVRDIALITTLLGLVSTVFDFLVFAVFRGFEPSILQTNWFIASVVTEIIFLFSIRTHLFFLKAKRPSWNVLFFSGIALCTTILLPFTPVGASFFSFHPPSLEHLTIILGIAVAYLIVSETVKLMYYRHLSQA